MSIEYTINYMENPKRLRQDKEYILESNDSIFGLGTTSLDQIIQTHKIDLLSDTSSISIETISIETSTDISSTDESLDKKELVKKKNSNNYKNKKTYKKKYDEVKEYIYYKGESISEFDKYSPFINMLIERRIKCCEMGPSCHIAAFVPNLGVENKFTNWAFGKFAIGENSERVRFGNNRLSTHAEMDALKKLDNLFRVKKCKKQKMDLIVIRINKSGNLCESAPCYHCTKELSKSSVVSINKLYFSRWDGTITCIKFSDWIKNENFHVSKGWKWLAKNSK